MILGILQARVSSTRLPGKVLKPILGKPMLARQIERLKGCRLLDRLLVATSRDLLDDPVALLCAEEGVDCFRGSLDDVLDRFYQAARPFHPAHVVRFTGDCPLIDPALVDSLIQFHLAGGYDYSSNSLEPTYPDGLDAEACRFGCLEQAWREAALASQREHVTPFIYRQPGRFSIGVLRNASDLSSLRWTVDEPADFDLVTEIYRALYPGKPHFDCSDILAFLDAHPELKSINTGHERNEGLRKSLIQDAPFNGGKGES